MTVNGPLDQIWKSYKVTCDCLKVAQRSIARDQTHLLNRTDFLNFSKDQSEDLIMKSRETSDDYVILSLWTAFERIILGYLQQQGRKILDSNPSAFNSKVHQKTEHEIEYWKMEEILDLFKNTVDSNLIGNIKQIKKYRDWVTHRNVNKPAPPNISPKNAYRILSQVLYELERNQDFQPS